MTRRRLVLLILVIGWLDVISAIKIHQYETVPMQRVKRSHHKKTLYERDFGGFDYILIPKTMSTMAKLVFCDLVRRQRKLPKVPVEVGKQNICVENNWYKHVQPRSGFSWKQPKLNDRATLLIVRDPFERFVSMYAYLCKQRKFCDKDMDIHDFAYRVYYSLKYRKLAKGFNRKDRKEVFRHIQPSFWFVYSRDNELPRNPEFMYLTLKRSSNARKLKNILIHKANVPPATAKQVVEPIEATYGNTLRTEEGKRDHELLAHLEAQVYKRRDTFLYVLKSYYNDYKLLKLDLPEPLARSLAMYHVDLPDRVKKLRWGRRILTDKCRGARHQAETGKSIPMAPC